MKERVEGQSEMRNTFPENLSAERFSEGITNFLVEYKNDPERREKLFARFDSRAKILFHGQDDIFTAVRAKIEALPLDDEQYFADEAGAILESALRAFLNPQNVREAARRHERMIREEEVSRHPDRRLSPEGMLVYGVDNETVHLHIHPAKTLTEKEKREDLNIGLRTLAKKLQEDPTLKDVTQITGTSWIVAAAPNMMRGLGFTIDPNPLDPEFLQKHFPDEKRPVRRASMPREEFLKKYGSEL